MIFSSLFSMGYRCVQARGHTAKRYLENLHFTRNEGVPSYFFQRLFWIVLLMASLNSGTALADDRYRTKLSLDVSAFKPNLQETIGWLTGLRWARYFGDSQLYWGFGAYYGTPRGKALTDEYLTFGGIQLGWELLNSKKTLFEFDLLIGYGQGEIQSIGLSQKSYYVAQPGAAFGFRLGQGWKALFTAQYVHMSDAKDFSGPSFGVRLEFKSMSSSKFLND
ncbi:hypothetical protein EBQ90_08260 [bacterium]|nr:hypothetical protein [bacterium]